MTTLQQCKHAMDEGTCSICDADEELPATLGQMVAAERKAHPQDAPDRIADRVCTALLARPDFVDLVMPAVRAFIRDACRSAARDVERRVGEQVRVEARRTSAFRAGPDTESRRRVFREGTDKVSTDPRRELLTEGFPLSGGVFVRWADATEADIETRIAELEKQRAALDGSIDFYRQRLAEMRAAGVKCYGDLLKRKRAKAS